jgi:serine/threonine-protein kinase RsbW
VSTSEPEAIVELSIPARPEYVGVARLAILGVASRMRFSYDEVEDIRLAVGEACTSVLDRTEGASNSPPIRICCMIDSGRLTVEVEDRVAAAPRDQSAEKAGLPDDVQLGGVLIRILMDEVTTDEDPAAGTHTIRMVKYVAR